ncbi:MAG TPA: hypothetical protein VFO85_03125, partial [Vicinamibacteria bacterium]|nr:hypothetical protein [Vicinamibacteria bacterium]
MTPPSSGSVQVGMTSTRGRRVAPDALPEADQELARGRHAAALAVVERALAGGAAGDVGLRLRLARGHALWLSGRTRAGAAEVEKAGPECREPLTRARALELLGLFDWKAQELERAGARLAEAQALWAQAPRARGAALAICRRAGLLRDSGRLVGALNLQAEAVVAALASGRDDVLGEARSGRAALLAALGRWTEAREEAEQAAALFRAGGDPREHTRAGLCRAVLELAAGELGAASHSLARAREAVCPEGSDPRTAGEIALLGCDLALAEGDAPAALALAGEALTL